MAELPTEISEQIWRFQREFLQIISSARELEYQIFQTLGENEQTSRSLEELHQVAQEGIERFQRFATIQIRVANEPEEIASDMLKLINSSISISEQRIPALLRSIEEIRLEWS